MKRLTQQEVAYVSGGGMAGRTFGAMSDDSLIFPKMVILASAARLAYLAISGAIEGTLSALNGKCGCNSTYKSKYTRC